MRSQQQQQQQHRQDRKTHHFFTIGLFGHILSILFVGLYGILDESIADVTHFHMESLGFTLERDLIVHAITLLTLVLLYVSFALKLTWPLRIEEMLVIIVIWVWIGNVFDTGGGGGIMCDSPTWWTTAAIPPQQQPNDTVVVIASDVVNANLHHLPQPHHHPILSQLPCGWSLFGVYFSLVCIGSSLLSFVANTRNYCLAFLFKTLTVLTTVVLFVVPLACNRFRLISTPVLILKLTLYNLAWNMNRFMVDTQCDIVGNYNKAGHIIEMIGNNTVPSHHTPRRRRVSHYDNEDDGDDSDTDEDDGDDEEDEIVHYSDDSRPRRLVPINVFRALEKTNRKARHLAPTTRRLTIEQKVHTEQLGYFSSLYKTSRKYRPSCFWSWRYRGHDDAVSDLTRTVWILAICPLYLFVAVIFLFILAYYIRRNQLELNATEKTLVLMTERTATLH